MQAKPYIKGSTFMMNCSECDYIHELTESQSYLYALGLFPYRCVECKKLRGVNPARHPTINRFQKGMD